MWALVTGASSGVGLYYATILASDYHYDLLLVSNQEKEIADTANRLSATYDVRAIGVYSDLSDAQSADRLHDYCHSKGMEVEVLVNNAGMFFMQRLTDASLKKIDTLLMLHAFTLTKMCRLFGEDMCKRGKGYILNMASMTAWMAMPGIQCYNASKAYVLNFSKSLWYELHPYGVGVTVMTPGAIDTGLYNLSPSIRKWLVRLNVSIPPERFARIALKKMFRCKKQAMPGILNYLFVPIINHLPDWAVFAAMKRLPMFR
ncbi:MAG: SDR family NAD(P)-dependent oxidoreductase [Paludibacter sp.]|nr:SDR family NAD(P)-dependent oxidoreductase [Bacteroidales bacterium]MCM1068959.1 SDR family NAD(P)-dependent oxidoreductase [Prevotella sp.]MCM1353622.1 SDR family NAD(P)-dependent oxidoreductase [Bacteroides sp.]MCM1442029.1 SDR family NAD(P)-dependent oxidoreductase [Muribaculum sp.]MCM1481515.1 SDR family NAD(P)-dependent oxidoreductase [Paludibacter sp.]